MLTQEGLLNKESNQDKKGKKTGLTVGGLLKKKDQDGSAVSEEPVEQPGESTEESSIPVVENLQEALEKPLEKPLEEYIPEKPEEAQLKIKRR
jgi:hypothetical protein